MKRMQIQFTEEQSARLRARARSQGVSISALVREAVDRVPDTGSPAWERALACIGIGKSGASDVSVRHDDYLAEAIVDGQKPL